MVVRLTSRSVVTAAVSITGADWFAAAVDVCVAGSVVMFVEDTVIPTVVSGNPVVVLTLDNSVLAV